MILGAEILEPLAKTLSEILTHSQIENYLQQCSIGNTSPDANKWIKLFNAFVKSQNDSQSANNILRFVSFVMTPARFGTNDGDFKSKKNNINKVLIYVGLELKDDGTIGDVEKANTVSDAQRRAKGLQSKLESRNVHPMIIYYCRSELLVDNYFHAVLEAAKSVLDRIRNLSGCNEDGAKLIDIVFAVSNPILVINTLGNESEKSEHTGFSNLLKGIAGMFRNPTAHAPKVSWEMPEEEALDIMTTLSFCHKKLDNTHKIR